MAELTAAQKLAEARAALHALLTGKKMVSVGYGDRRVQYTQTNIAELRGYIDQLMEEAGETRTDRQIRRPLRGIF